MLDKLDNLLVESNPHWLDQFENYAPRLSFARLVEFLNIKQIITISGIRRSGKSTLAKMAIKYLVEQGTAPRNIFYLNLEQPMFLEHRSNPDYLNFILERFLKLSNTEGKKYIFLDEIQFFDNWQVFVKSKYENTNFKFVVTGSNSTLLSDDLNTLLSGRSLNVHVNTFSFSEFLQYQKIKTETELDRSHNKIKIAQAKDFYLKWGGFFEVFTAPNDLIRKEILSSYAKNILYLDIVPRLGVRNSDILEKLFYFLLGNIGSQINYTNLANTFSVSDKTVKEFILAFEQSFLMQRIDRFHFKSKEKIKSAKKIYVLDNGFIQIVNRWSEDFSKRLENTVFNHCYAKDRELTYLKNLYEVDFYTKGQMIQVSYDISDIQTKDREIRAFTDFPVTAKEKFLVNYDQSYYEDDVKVLKIEDFLLEN